MRVERVVTNETCNQNCAFCNARRPTEQPSFVQRGAVLGRIQSATAGAPEQVVLTGGEPTLRRDLADLVAAAKARAGSVVLETNAALVDDAMAARLSTAGLDLARVHLPAWGESLDAITRDSGGFAATLAGMRSLAARGVRLEVAIPVVRDNLDDIAEVPAGLARAGLPVEAIVVGVPAEGPDAAGLASLGEAAQAIEQLVRAARTHGTTLRMSADAFIPPCSFQRPALVAHLYTLTPGGRERGGCVRIAACQDCLANDRCPGFPAAWGRATLPNRPVRDDRLRRRLSVISTLEEQVARELVTHEVHRNADGTVVPVRTVRVNFHCNQACHFCFVSTHLPAAADSEIRAAILEAGRAGAMLAISGGEPTLNPELANYVRLARSSGVTGVELQTNATRLDNVDLVHELADAGVDVAFVSLHGSTAAISDLVTDAPGTFEKTVRGIDELYRSPIHVRLNFVFCALNQDDFPDHVRMVAARWPGVDMSISFVAPSTDMVPRDRSLVPRYTDVLPPMAEGLRLGRELRLNMLGFESMCGLPLCLIPVGMEEYFGVAELPSGEDHGEFIKTDTCARCSIEQRCWGLRRGYAELNGTAELRAVER